MHFRMDTLAFRHLGTCILWLIRYRTLIKHVLALERYTMPTAII